MPARRKAPNAFDPFGLDIERMFGPDHLKHNDAIEVASLYPALLSGLACAGANNPPRSLVAGSLDVGDGVLTALEVAGLDLTGCRLAVLSACRTGLGNVAGARGCWVCNGPSTRRVWLPWSPASGTSTTRPPPFSWRNSTPTSGVKNCHHSWLCGGQPTVLNRPRSVSWSDAWNSWRRVTPRTRRAIRAAAAGSDVERTGVRQGGGLGSSSAERSVPTFIRPGAGGRGPFSGGQGSRTEKAGVTRCGVPPDSVVVAMELGSFPARRASRSACAPVFRAITQPA